MKMKKVVERKQPQVQKVEVHIESRLRVGGEDDVEVRKQRPESIA